MRVYEYIGNPEFIPQGTFPHRTELNCAEALAMWMKEHRDELDLEECIPATFIIDADGRFWIADRASEHVACARLGAVRTAGEVFFTGLDATPSIHRITNQSTGYCPEPDSWGSVVEALSPTGLAFPHEFDPAFLFRRCEECRELAIVKNGDFTCLTCGGKLPHAWNVRGKQDAAPNLTTLSNAKRRNHRHQCGDWF